MSKYREEKLESLMREKINQVILRDLDIPSSSVVTLTEVTVNDDMQYAKAYVSVIPSISEEDVFNYLKKEQGRVQYLVNNLIPIRRVPRIEFVIDHRLEKDAVIEKALIDSGDL